MTIMNFEDLKGQTLRSITDTGNEVRMVLEDGRAFRLYHEQDCCESVRVEDVIGDLSDLVGSPLTMAEEIYNAPDPDDRFEKDNWGGTHTWTFYKLATVNGYVTIRWLGSSNGYYSESVLFGPC